MVHRPWAEGFASAGTSCGVFHRARPFGIWIEPINSDEFLRVVSPALNSSSADELARRVGERWTPRQLCELLHSECPDVRKVTCVVLGLVGDESVTGCLAAALRDSEADVSELAEHALWSLWFRGGNEQAQRCFKRGLAAMERECHEEALLWFHDAREADPDFAEAYNQCGIAHYMLEQWESALADCRRTAELVPLHFGALAGQGHCYAQLGDLGAAAGASADGADRDGAGSHRGMRGVSVW
jgi:tetratricopeptide (TPR) repeat protein